MKNPNAEQEKVNQLLTMVGEALDSRRYTEAKSNVEKVLKIQPFNPLGLFYKGLAIVRITDESCNVTQAYNEYAAAVKAGKAYKAKENRLNSQMKKLSKGYQDAIFNFTWVLKQNIYPVPNNVRDATEDWITVCEFGLMYYGMIPEAVEIANVELAKNMQIPKHKFDLGMHLWTFCSDEYETIPFAAEYYIIPAILNMSQKEREDALSTVNMFAARNINKFDDWYEVFMKIWSNALGIDDEFEAAASQLPRVSFRMLILSESIPNLKGAIRCIYRSIYEYEDPVSVRKNIIQAHNSLDYQLPICDNGNKEYVKTLKAYSSAFKDVYEISGFMDSLTRSDSGIVILDGYEYDPRPLIEELYTQYTKLFKNKKEIEKIKNSLSNMLHMLCKVYGYERTMHPVSSALVG